MEGDLPHNASCSTRGTLARNFSPRLKTPVITDPCIFKRGWGDPKAMAQLYNTCVYTVAMPWGGVLLMCRILFSNWYYHSWRQVIGNREEGCLNGTEFVQKSNISPIVEFNCTHLLNAKSRNNHPNSRNNYPKSRNDHPNSRNDHPESRNDHPESRNDHPNSRNDHPKSRNDHPKSRN